jgi:hypothetical protein
MHGQEWLQHCQDCLIDDIKRDFPNLVFEVEGTRGSFVLIIGQRKFEFELYDGEGYNEWEVNDVVMDYEDMKNNNIFN